MFVMPKFGCTIFLVPLDVRSRYKAIGFLVYISHTYNNIISLNPLLPSKIYSTSKRKAIYYTWIFVHVILISHDQNYFKSIPSSLQSTYPYKKRICMKDIKFVVDWLVFLTLQKFQDLTLIW
jgi:hypothetical protein